MSIHVNPEPNSSKITIKTIQVRKETKQKITVLTAYDYPSARFVDDAGIDIILVGDSLANAVLGYDSTLSVTMDEMLSHSCAVQRGVKNALLVGDMPFGSYHTSVDQGLESAIRFIKEGGMEAVKLEGGKKRATLIGKIVENDIPVMGHIGLTPQSLHSLGGYKVQGKTIETAKKLIDDALALEEVGVFAIVLECIPSEVAAIITDKIKIPTIGIGASVHCDGQVLVLSDLLGFTFGHTPRFVRKYADLKPVIKQAIENYKEDILKGEFPSNEESYKLPEEIAMKLKKSNLGFTS